MKWDSAHRCYRATKGDAFYGQSCPKCASLKSVQALLCFSCRKEAQRRPDFYELRTCACCGGPKKRDSARCRGCAADARRGIPIIGRSPSAAHPWRTRRSTAVALLASLILAGAVSVANADGRHDNTGTLETGLYRNHTAAFWAWKFRRRTRQYQAARAFLQRRWRPTVNYALRLAAAVSGVSYWELRSVSWCESTHNPFASNGRYRGLFQLGWSPFGLSPYDPVANAISAAMTVRHDGGWYQWECKP